MDSYARIKLLEKNLQVLVDSVIAYRMRAMCESQNLANTAQADMLKKSLEIAKAALNEHSSEPER